MAFKANLPHDIFKNVNYSSHHLEPLQKTFKIVLRKIVLHVSVFVSGGLHTPYTLTHFLTHFFKIFIFINYINGIAAYVSLENRQGCKPFQGSNPCLPATYKQTRHRAGFFNG